MSRSVWGAPGDEMEAAFDGLCRAVVDHMANRRLSARKAADIGWVRRGGGPQGWFIRGAGLPASGDDAAAAAVYTGC